MMPVPACVPQNPRNEIINDGKGSKGSDLRIYEELGSGSFGKVYRAFEPALNKVVAIKMIELDTSNDIEDVLLELKFLSELRCEQITRHYYATLHGSVLFVVMEYCAAGSCMYMLQSHSRFREESAAYVIQQVLKGLSYIHLQNKIHRDLKSANILVTRDYGVKIADFGVSAQLSGTVTARNSFMGTPYWMAPEIIESSRYNTAVDIWSLGIVAFELITGSPPHRQLQPNDAMMRIVNGDPPSLPHINRGHTISKSFSELVSACLTKDPKLRPSADRLLSTKYIRLRSHPPTDFKAMVNSIVRARHSRVQTVKPRTTDDVKLLAPPKSKKSRYKGIAAQAPKTESSSMSEFDLSFDTKSGTLNSPLVPLRPHSLAEAHNRPQSRLTSSLGKIGNKHRDRNPPSYINEYSRPQRTPEVPPRLRNPKHSNADQGHHHGARTEAAVKEGATKESSSNEIWTQWMRKALEKVKSRAQVPTAAYEIDRLQREIEALDEAFTGFTRAFVEELWRLILESAH